MSSEDGIRNILPDKGLWTLEDMAEYLKIDTSELQQRLTDKGIKVLALSNRYKHKLISLESIIKVIDNLK
jgi:predicted HTH domain antitoxin